jgi:Ankyrin repeats (many copies)
MSVASIELLCAAVSGDLNRLRSLLAQGVDVNSSTKANQTALMLATAFKRVEIVKYLVAAGADVTLQDELGLTAADWARGDTRITQLFTVDERLKHPLPELIDDTVAPAVPPRAPARVVEPDSDSELPKAPGSLDIPVPHALLMSRANRTLFRVGMVFLLLAGGFLSYHLVTSVLSTRTSSGGKPQPAPIQVEAATKPTKSAPAVGGELAGAALFLPDAEYPPDAIVASGTVTVGIQVSRKGIVVKAEALDGDESLRSAAEKAAWSSAFAPEKLENTSSLIDGTITYNFLKANDVKPRVEEFGFSIEAITPTNVSATAGGPLAGAERRLVIPKIPERVRVEQESTTVVVRVNRAGRVMSWRPLDVDTRLRAYLIKAARASTFNPDKLPGEGQVVGIITYKFQ